MSKERFLTILVPISDADAESTVYASDAALVAAVPPLLSNIDKIYKIEDGTYRRVWKNPSTDDVEYHTVTDREFPYLGNPIEIYDFTYDATRMGTAPTVSAQNVMWYADKDADGNDITLDDMWNRSCHVIFNGNKLYLKQIPTSSKSNEDARYKYDLDFVDETVILEHIYLYDIVSPFITDKPISESSTFSFYGDISELANRINASLIRSGLSTLIRKYVYYPVGLQTVVPYLTFEQWNLLNKNPQVLIDEGLFINASDYGRFYMYIYNALGGNYSRYLLEYIYENENGVYVVNGYQCKIGNDKYGNPTTSEEKQISFNNNYIHDALQEVHDTFELEYYIEKEKDQSGEYTGNVFINIADCEHDFADWDSQEDDYVRDDEGIPTTENPFDYGVEDELLSKEKTNTTDKVITRITGVGGDKNIPWYYPNPNPDGWIKPYFARKGVDQLNVKVDYPTDEGSTPEENSYYEKFLKNRIGVSLKKGAVNEIYTSSDTEHSVLLYGEDETNLYVIQYFVINTNEKTNPRITVNLNYNEAASKCNRLLAQLRRGDTVVSTFDSDETYADPSFFQTMFINRNGNDIQPLVANLVYTLIVEYQIPKTDIPSSGIANFTGYHYPDYVGNALYPGTSEVIGQFHTGENFYEEENLVPYYKLVVTGGTETHPFYDLAEAGYSTNGQESGKRSPLPRLKNTNFKDNTTGYIYKCLTSTPNYPHTGNPQPAFELNPKMDYKEWYKAFVDFTMKLYVNDGWYVGNEKIVLGDYGVSAPYREEGGEHINIVTDIFDAINFERLKWLTPQQKLMPEVFVKTDGERRFYNAKNYWKNNALIYGTADTAIGEVQVSSQIRNPLFKDEETDPDNKHYEFESEYLQQFAREHIENFDDVFPTLKEQRNFVLVDISQDQFNANKTYFYTFDKVNEEFVQCTDSDSFDSDISYFAQLRIDVVEEFAYDNTDNDEIWEDSSDGSIQGEYKHPYFFAKLRPMGFNIFDMALQEDMVISMTTGDCGACNFRIGVDENNGGNPVQLWDYDVYKGDYIATAQKLYDKGTLRRYVNLTGLYYDTDPNHTQEGYIPIVDTEGILEGDKPLNPAASVALYQNYNYTEEAVSNGRVGTMKNGNSVHFEGDVVTNGRLQESQQDTTSNYVWVALMKDTQTYGTLMPSARPNYNDPNLNVYIRPASVADVHVNENQGDSIDESTMEEDEENADKFVILNIRMPQVYFRRAERLLSHKLVEYMYEHNYQKFNFSIKFSRIYIEDNPNIDNLLNENSVLYVLFNNKIYRQYVKHYTYRMSHDEPLPEISVDMNEELSVSKTINQQWDDKQKKNNQLIAAQMTDIVRKSGDNISRKVVKKEGSAMMAGNIIIPGENTSLIEMARKINNSSGGGGTGVQWGEF